MLIAAYLLASSQSGLSAASAPLATLIGRARTARGSGQSTVRSIYTAGTIDADGVRRAFQSWTDRTNGRYAIITDSGPLSWSEGYDGRVAWWRDSKGIVLPQTGPASLDQTAISVFDNTGALFKPGFGGLSVSYLGKRTDSGKDYEAIEVRLRDGYAVENWYDSATALLLRQVATNDGQTVTTDYSDYQDVMGLMTAHQIRISFPNGAPEVVHVTAARTDVPDLEKHLGRPLSAVNDYSLPGGQTTVPIKYADHEIFVDVKINGKGPFRFAFDSGGHNLMDPTVAWAVGASSIGSTRPRGGIGEGSSIMQLVRVGQLAIGNATLTDQYFGVTHIERPAAFIGVQGFSYVPGPQGLIGWEVLARFVTTVDYPAARMILRSAQGASQAPVGETIPLLFDHTMPEFTCHIGGVQGTCAIDTGSAGSVSVTSPFARRNKNIVPAGLDTTGYNFWGFGGRSRGGLGTISSFQIGPVTLTNVEAAFSSDQKGALANSSLAAIVGNKVWSRFALTFDYARASMVLAGNSASGGN
jgi:hypothetical protein